MFSSFDDHHGVSFLFSIVVWRICMVRILSIPIFWVKASSFWGLLKGRFLIVWDLVVRRKAKVLGRRSFYSRLFLVLVLLNMWGLVPYVFRLTRHLAVNLQISLPVWLAIVLIRIRYNLGDFLAHLQPLGSPAPLNPFLCAIELVSLIVRPLTLAVRLTANLRTGHILMALLGTGFMYQPWVVVLGIFYCIFEIAVCVIQAYIFTLLPTLYSEDHS